MPRIFSEADRRALRQALIDAGRVSFLRFGLRKTSVEQLARAVGIAKGTFYGFFESKEDLCAAIFEQEEAQRHDELEAILTATGDPSEILRALLRQGLDYVRGDSLVTALRESGELAQVARGSNRERWSEHFRHDTDFMRSVLEECARRGGSCDLDPEIASGVVRAVVTLGFHEAEIGPDVFPATIDRIVGWVAQGMTEAERTP